MGGSPNPALDPGLPVWLVTVDTLMDVSRAPDDTHPVRTVYTVISDAANGAVIDTCAGCDAVTSDKGATTTQSDVPFGRTSP